MPGERGYTPVIAPLRKEQGSTASEYLAKDRLAVLDGAAHNHVSLQRAYDNYLIYLDCDPATFFFTMAISNTGTVPKDISSYLRAQLIKARIIVITVSSEKVNKIFTSPL